MTNPIQFIDNTIANKIKNYKKTNKPNLLFWDEEVKLVSSLTFESLSSMHAVVIAINAKQPIEEQIDLELHETNGLPTFIALTQCDGDENQQKITSKQFEDHIKTLKEKNHINLVGYCSDISAKEGKNVTEFFNAIQTYVSIHITITPNSYIKVLLKGPAGSGKTSLMKRVCRNEFPENCEPTRGFRIDTWELASDVPTTLNKSDLDDEDGKKITDPSKYSFSNTLGFFVLTPLTLTYAGMDYILQDERLSQDTKLKLAFLNLATLGASTFLYMGLALTKSILDLCCGYTPEQQNVRISF